MSTLTKISIPIDAFRDPEVAAQLSTPYGVHQLLWHMFRRSQDEERQFLYRAEFVGARPHVLVWSPTEPLREPPAPLRSETKVFAPRLSAGAPLCFDLRVNPTVSVPAPGNARGHVADVVMAAKAEDREEGARVPEAVRVHVATSDWLSRRQEKWGVSFDTEHLVCSRYEQHAFKKSRSSRAIRFSSVDVSGRLVVDDPELLMRALQSGIGRAKAWGCGLLLLRR